MCDDGSGCGVESCLVVLAYTCERKNPRYLHVLNPLLLQKGDYLDAALKSYTLTTCDDTDNRKPHHTVITYLLDIFSSYCFYGPNHYLLRRRPQLSPTHHLGSVPLSHRIRPLLVLSPPYSASSEL